jgi:flagellar hook-length control protein FliK
VGREFQLTNEDHSGYQAASNEQAERQVSETGNQDAVKGFGHLLGAGMARLQPEAMTSTRSPLAELPSQLRSLDTPVGTKAWGQGVGERIQWMLSNGASSAEIRLNPQHLGPLEIRISLHNDQTQVSILAQHGATRDAIEASLPRRREMFQESNLNLGNVDVGRREAQTQQQGPGQQQGQGSEGKGRGFFAGADEELGADALAGQIRRVSTALIDDFA